MVNEPQHPQVMPGESWVLNICMNKLMDFLKARFTVRRSCIDLYGFLCDYVNNPKSFFSLSGPSCQDKLHTEILMEAVSGPRRKEHIALSSTEPR